MKIRRLLLLAGLVVLLAACGGSSDDSDKIVFHEGQASHELTLEEFQQLATLQEEEIAEGVARLIAKRELERVKGAITEARLTGGVVDIGDGLAVVRFKVGSRFNSAEEAKQKLETDRDEWASTHHATILDTQEFRGVT
jgi:hypothetical protein